jgi:hypothetical protein
MQVEVSLNEQEVEEAVQMYLEDKGYTVDSVKLEVGRDFGRLASGQAIFKGAKANVRKTD